MSAGGDIFHWVVRNPILHLSDEHSQNKTEKQFIANLDGAEPTIWTITLQRTCTERGDYLGLWLSSSITADNFQNNIKRCLPRYHLTILTETAIELSSMADIWVPSLTKNEYRGTQSFISFNNLLDAMQESRSKSIIIKLQLQYRNTEGKVFPFSTPSMIKSTTINYSLMGEIFSCQSNIFARSNIVYSEMVGNSYNVIDFDAYVDQNIKNNLHRSYANLNKQSGEFNRKLVNFLIEPCEARLSVCGQAELLYLLSLFNEISILLYADITASVLLSTTTSVNGMIAIRNSINDKIPSFELLFWHKIYSIYSQKQLCALEKMTLTRFFKENNISLENPLSTKLGIFRAMRKLGADSLTVNTDDNHKVGYERADSFISLGTNSAAA